MNKWWHNAVIYQIYPKSFNDSNNDGIGDIPGIIQKLDYLKELGINLIWLSPVYSSPMKDNGYDISNYQDINPMFGTLKDMDNFILEAKKRGIGILMDLVVNHTSDQHPWFLEAKKSKDNPYRDYYIWRDEASDLGSTFGGSAWTYDEETKQFYFHNFAKEQPDLNWQNPKVLEEIVRMINWWMERGIAGFRMDVIELLGKDIDKKILGNGPTLHPILKELYQKSFGNYDSFTVGEVWGANVDNAGLYCSPERKELSTVFQFEHMTIDWGSLGKWNPHPLDKKRLKEIFTKWQTKFLDGTNSLFWNNHDLPRIVSRWGNDTIYHYESATMLAILLHFMKGIPYIYQGEEIGMTNVHYDSLEDYDDVEIHQTYNDIVTEKHLLTKEEFMNGVYLMGRDNARTPMQWNASKNGGFSEHKPWLKSNPNYQVINVEKDQSSKKSIFAIYQKLTHLRTSSIYSDIMIYGEYLPLEAIDEIFAYQRTYLGKTITVICNFSNKPNSYMIPKEKIILSNYDNQDNFLRPFEAIVTVSE